MNEHSQANWMADMVAKVEQAEAERDAARAALGRAVRQLDLIWHTPDGAEPQYNCDQVDAIAAILADPQGQQAAQEWRAMQAFISDVRQLAASWSDMVGIPRDIKDLLADLDKAQASQQPPAAGEEQQR